MAYKIGESAKIDCTRLPKMMVGTKRGRKGGLVPQPRNLSCGGGGDLSPQTEILMGGGISNWAPKKVAHAHVWFDLEILLNCIKITQILN